MARSLLVLPALMHHDLLHELPQEGGGQLLEAGVLPHDRHELVYVPSRLLGLPQFRLQLGGTGFQRGLLLLIIGGQLHETLVRDAATHAVLIQTLEDAVQLPDALLCRLQLPAAGGVLPLAAVSAPA